MSLGPLRLSRRMALAAALLLPAGCSEPSPFAPVCPKLSLLRDAADLTRFAGAADAPHDARSLALVARISAVPAKCGNGPKDKVLARLNVVIQARRGPAFRGDVAELPYFVGITDGDRVATERDFVVAAKFRANVDQVTVSGEEIDLALPVSSTKTAAAYHVYVGFRLTADELAENRKADTSE